MEKHEYVIRGGARGRKRLRVLSRVMQPTTLDLLRRAGARPGMVCMDAGCGGGDLTFDLARIVGPEGRVVGVDFDEVKLELARNEAHVQQLSNVEFRKADLTKPGLQGEFDLIHARFLLMHLRNPEEILDRMFAALVPGGVVVIEDIDFQGYFCYPECPALRRYVELYQRSVRLQGADPCIGPRLPSLLASAGFQNVQMNVVQPAGITGDVKLISPLTMEAIAEAVIRERLASEAEVEEIVAELYEYARTPGTVGCMPRVVETWGWKR